MVDIAEMMAMLDWNMPLDIQAKGISLAKDFDSIAPFIQPITANYHKNVWDNCAKIIAEADDRKLERYLVELLAWLQDMNWPGAFCILHRLQRYANEDSIHRAINVCIEKAQSCNDELWESNLHLLLKERDASKW